jgi:hypothetical protein
MYSIQDHFPVYSVFLLILIISGSTLLELFSCRIRYLFNNSILLNHFIAYLTLVFFIVITIPVREKHILRIIPGSVILYAFFLGLIKTAFPYFVSILAIIMVIYILVLYKSELQDEIDKLRVNVLAKDTSLAEDEKIKRIISAILPISLINEDSTVDPQMSKTPASNVNNIQSTTVLSTDTKEIKNVQTQVNNIVFTNNLLFVAIVPLYITGFALYLTSKLKKYKSRFSFFTFFFGKITCSKSKK